MRHFDGFSFTAPDLKLIVSMLAEMTLKKSASQNEFTKTSQNITLLILSICKAKYFTRLNRRQRLCIEFLPIGSIFILKNAKRRFLAILYTFTLKNNTLLYTLHKSFYHLYILHK